jgi:hypothetical protein
MVMDLIRCKGKDAPGLAEHASEVEGVRAAIAAARSRSA